MFGITKRAKLNAAVLGAAIVAAAVAVPGAAYAIAERPPLAENPGACASGGTWRDVMPDNMVVTLPCVGGAQQQAFVGHPAIVAPAREPLTTGSIRTAKATPGNRMIMVAGPQDCRPGAYWMMTLPNNGDTTTPIACP